MAKKICKHEGSRVLLVEGRDDCHVVLALCEVHQVAETFGIYSCDSDDQVLRRLNALIGQRNPDAVIGVLLDADRPDVERRWQSIRGKLSRHPYHLPESPDPKGTVLEPDGRGPRLGFWLMPDNERSGMLEDFLVELAVPESRAFAGQCVDQASTKGFASFKERHRTKAVVHTYLAWQDEPGRPLGQAITAQALRPETELAHRFSDWLKRLFA